MLSSFVFLAVISHVFAPACAALYSNRWAVELEEDAAEHADHIAQEHGFRNMGQIGSLENHYLFVHDDAPRRTARQSDLHHQLKRSTQVRGLDQLEMKKRVKRDVTPHLSDPNWSDMWYVNRAQLDAGPDMNVSGAWRLGVTGRGVVVSILDDGIEHTHPDLTANYDPAASTDINGHDSDPFPRYDTTESNGHGTRCAGEVASSANNSVCGVGVAYNCKIGGVRMLDVPNGRIDDSVEAASLSLNPQHIDIYSASWGPEDNGAVVEGPGPLAKVAFLNGIAKGRKGRGSIFVWASGDGGDHQDSCACDGYTNNLYTLSISSVTEHGQKPFYLEECSSTLATTYSSGNSRNDRQIISTDLHGRCTNKHTGTSASAPLAAGLVALALEANPNLTWRDMQYVVLLTSRADAIADKDWLTNGVGRKVNHKYGYGLMDAGAMVEMALKWNTVPEQHMCTSKANTQSITIDPHEKVESRILFDGCSGTKGEVRYLEHVQALVTVTSKKRGSLVITLYSPRGTSSVLLNRRPHDRDGSHGFRAWPFLTRRLWGEDPRGEWRLVVKDADGYTGQLVSWSLVAYGTNGNPNKI